MLLSPKFRLSKLNTLMIPNPDDPKPSPSPSPADPIRYGKPTHLPPEAFIKSPLDSQGPLTQNPNPLRYGTLTHLPPEAFINTGGGVSAASRAGDIYAFGVALWQVSSGSWFGV